MCFMKCRAPPGHHIVATTFIHSWSQKESSRGLEQYEADREKKEFFCFYGASFHPNSILPNNDQVHTVMTAASYSSNEHHSASSSSHWVEQRRERKTIMFLSSKLCLLIALLLGWLLMDITFHAVPQAAVWSSAFFEMSDCVMLLLN